MNYFAHISGDGRDQTVEEHLSGTSKLCGEYAAAFGFSDQGELTGLMHDIGKYSEEFQRRLEGGAKVDHSTAGAYECTQLGQIPAAFCIAGHHGGLPDGGTPADVDGGSFFSRINKAKHGQLPKYTAWSKEVSIPSAEIPPFCRNSAEMFFFTKMLYSCLVDADFKDTESFMFGAVRETQRLDFDLLNTKLIKYITPWFPPRGDLNAKRCAILDHCMERGENCERGIFSLTVPTGGGKTVASLAFALRHAKRNGMDRIIYVVPYTSIIEQIAEKFREILGEENVLEHHSGVLFDVGESGNDIECRKARATEDWDMPVIVTTAVQFFESIFSNKPAKSRKVHNIANSVIVFDEAQMIPNPYLLPCVFAISQLVSHYKSSAVLCTATQPALNSFFRKYIPNAAIQEICPENLYNDDIFERVSFQKAGLLTWEELGKRLLSCKQTLCIVNSRKNAQTVYSMLPEEGSYHLSTLMAPEHRKRVLKEIKSRLIDGAICRVVSTSLIEAGVDVDFPKVFREEAGLDSILQAAGRCNREGKRSVSDSVVTVFRSESKAPPVFSTSIAAGRIAMQENDDISGKRAVKRYFKELYSLKGEAALDQKTIMKHISSGTLPFAAVSERFKLIDTDTKTVYIPKDKGAELCARLTAGEHTRQLYRNLGQYSVSVYENHFRALESAGAITLLDDGSAILADMALYSDKTGLSLHADSGQAMFI